MNRKPVNYEEFEAFLSQFSDQDSRIVGLPRTASQFESWWKRISVSAELQSRWTRRIRLGEKFFDEIASEIESIRRVA